MKAVILAGGKGTRLAPYTRVFPKPMLPIGDKTILEILLSQIKHSGIDEVVLTVGHLAGLMRAFFQDGKNYGLDITYSLEAKPLGTAGPLAHIEGLEDTFLVANGDVLTTLDICDLIRFHKEHHAILTIAMHQRKVKVELGVIEQDERYRVIGYNEKPTLQYNASMGIYVFEPAVLQYVSRDTYMDFPYLVKLLIEKGETVMGYPFDGYWRDLGNPQDYEEAAVDFKSMRSQFIPEE